jgi:rod shape-determining protein MreD
MVVSLIVQGHSSFDVLRIAGAKPDLLFIAVLYFGYNFGSFYGEVTGFAGGLFHDAVSSSPLGLLAFPKVVIGYAVGFIGRSILKPSLLTILILVFGSSLVKGLLTLFLSFLFQDATISSVATIIFPEAFYNMFLAPPLFFIFDKIFAHELEGGSY